ncbi:histone acetyltransferase GCN5-like protein [Parathielavia appendiculata]|uniref:Histone acetyltransferase GCN5-like protein n=1 Tax=Parathielavia appendiculata TaxID=2587402 RepID=A0AAN6TZ29_9PEZI|nr:histone acetyltransferase GCN5-like protein [Parathielavia appendiculata]
MAKADAHSVLADLEHALPATKRAPSEEPSTASDPKTIKLAHEGMPDAAAHPPAHEKIEFRAVNNNGSRKHMIILTGLKCHLQEQLPGLPMYQIARLVYDRTHLSMAIVKHPLEVIGGIPFREFRGRKFAEIVFCAVSFNQQAHLKDYVKATSPLMHFLTYADNYATGYFQKQGFTKDMTLDKSIWMGYIKDYEGGTLMQCSMFPRICYLEVGRMLLKQKEAVQAKIRTLSKSHIIHQPPQQWAAASGTLARAQPRHGPHFNEPRRFLYQIQNHKQAWPSPNPANKDEVPDYYNVIASPMDLSTIEERLEADAYAAPRDTLKDPELIFSNCRQYNDATTVYAKYATKLERYMWGLKVPEWFDSLEEE